MNTNQVFRKTVLWNGDWRFKSYMKTSPNANTQLPMRMKIGQRTVEDNPNDAELAMRALKKNNLTNNVIRVGDGEEDWLLLNRQPDIKNLVK